MIKDANILIIDDEAVIRDGCNKILVKEGWKVTSAENGKKGLELIENNNFDILLLDLMMPGMSGLEVLSEVKIKKPELYIIVITGYATIETAVEAMKNGAFDYVSKPFTPDQLRMVVRKVLDNKALHMEAEFLRKEQEKGLKAIAQEKSKIKTIMDCMPNGVLVIDGEKKIALYNPKAAELLNINGTEFIGRDIGECINCEKLSGMINNVLQSRAGDNSSLSFEIEEKSYVPLMAHVSPVIVEGENVIGAVVILQDISEQKSIDRMKSDFIAKVTHELKTPAATINQLLMTLQSGVVGDLKDDQKYLIERARLWGEGMLELVSDLLNISKIESGIAPQNYKPTDFKEIIDYVIDLIKPQADKKKITIRSDLNGSLPKVKADKSGMIDVFTNLINNAVKYSDDGTEINISGEIQNDFVKISVTDSGFGISKKDIPQLFDRFYRVKNDKTRRILGTGLGLPIVKEIVDSHNGLIKVDSEEGKGSTFSVFLPCIVDKL